MDFEKKQTKTENRNTEVQHKHMPTHKETRRKKLLIHVYYQSN